MPRYIPQATPDIADDPKKLYRYLREVERALQTVDSNVRTVRQNVEVIATRPPDFQLIRDELQSTGSAPLSISNLHGIPAETQNARADAILQIQTTPAYLTLNTELALVDLTTAGATTVYLPGNPHIGYRVTIKDAAGDAAANNITVNGNGKNIGSASTSVINTNGGSRTFWYIGDKWEYV